MTDLYLVGLVFVLAAFVQGVVGFGFGMIAMGLLASLLSIGDAVPTVALLALVTNVAVLWENRAGVRRAAITPLLVGGFVGVPLGVYFLHSAEPAVLRTTLGTVLVAYALRGLLARGQVPVAPPIAGGWRDSVGMGAALLGGAIGAAFNTGGPPLIVYVAWRRFAPGVAKATLQAFFLVTAVYQIGLYSVTGTITVRSLHWVAVGLPALGIGLAAGFWLARRMDAAAFRRVVLLLLLVLGAHFFLA